MNTFGIIGGRRLVLLNQHKSWDEPVPYQARGWWTLAAIPTDDDYGTRAVAGHSRQHSAPMDGFRAYEPVAEMPRCIGHDDLMI